MGKHFSYCAKNVRPLSQNFRPSGVMAAFQTLLLASYNSSPKAHLFTLPRTGTTLLTQDLCVKAYYIHKVKNKIDADNISKPLWDAFNGQIYKDDRQLKYLETLKVDISTVGSCEFDITNIDDYDLHDLVDFLFNPASTDDQLLYLEVSDLDLKKVRL